jgi:hypothetical protein
MGQNHHSSEVNPRGTVMGITLADRRLSLLENGRSYFIQKGVNSVSHLVCADSKG